MNPSPATLSSRSAVRRRPSVRVGFTLVEVLIVVVILGVLAAIVIPQFASASESAVQSTFASNLKRYIGAAQLYQQETGQFLEDSSTGTVPSGFDAYIDGEEWAEVTVIGGRWDTEFQDSGGVTSAIGVVFEGSGTTRDDAFMAIIDGIVDDGNLTTGGFRRLETNRFYAILQE